MSVIPLTVFCSLGLVFVFVVLFWREQRRRFGSAERDSLLPLADETPRLAHPTPTPAPAAGAPGAAEPEPTHHSADACGCTRGEHSPCAGCERRSATPA